MFDSVLNTSLPLELVFTNQEESTYFTTSLTIDRFLIRVRIQTIFANALKCIVYEKYKKEC